MTIASRLFGLGVLMGAASVAAAAALAEWPSRPIRCIVPAAPGGAIDIVARIGGEQLTTRLGKQIVVDNRPGADGAIGLEALAKAPADGYTIGAVTDAVSVIRFVNRGLPFDALNDFAPITLLITQPRVFVVNASFPAATFKEFVGLAKARPGTIPYASGTAAHRLTAELMKKLAGIDIAHVPYKGGAPAVADLVGGQIPSALVGLSPVLPHARAGRLRILAVTTAARSSIVPQVPTLAESGLAGFDVYEWMVMLAPAHTPRAIVARVNAELAATLATSSVHDRLLAASLEPKSSSPEQAADLMRNDQARWVKVISDVGLRLDAQ